MAKGGNKNATKSFVMLIVTGVVLVAVTLCWFAINKNSSVKDIDSSVNNNASTKATLYVGKTDDGEIAITSDKNNKKCIVKYETAETVNDTIVLENMIPGAEYFYKAVFLPTTGIKDIKLTFTDVVESKLNDMITVHSRLTTSEDSIIYAPEDHEDTKKIQLQAWTEKNIIDAKNVESTETTEYVVYFSFKFSDEATIGTENTDGTTGVDYRNQSVTIGSIDTVMSSSAS